MPSIVDQKFTNNCSSDEATLQDLQQDLAFSDDSAVETDEEPSVISDNVDEILIKNPTVGNVSLTGNDVSNNTVKEPQQQNGLPLVEKKISEPAVISTESIATGREKRIRKRKSMDDDFISSSRVKILSNGDAAINKDDRITSKPKAATSVHNIPPIKYNVGELVWARITGHPWWPCMICSDVSDKSEKSHTKLVGISKLKRHYFVEFFGPSVEHAWIPDNSLIEYKGMEEFKAFAQQQVDEAPTKSAKERLAERFQLKVALSRREQWEQAVQEADSITRKSSRERVKWLAEKIDAFKKRKRPEKITPVSGNRSANASIQVPKKAEPLDIASKLKYKNDKSKRSLTKGLMSGKTFEKAVGKNKFRSRSFKRRSLNSLKDVSSDVVPKSEPVEVADSANENNPVPQKIKSGQRAQRISVPNLREADPKSSRISSCLICHRSFEQHKYSCANIARHLLSCSKKSAVGKLSHCPFCHIAFAERNWNVNHIKRHIMSCSKKATQNIKTTASEDISLTYRKRLSLPVLIPRNENEVNFSFFDGNMPAPEDKSMKATIPTQDIAPLENSKLPTATAAQVDDTRNDGEWLIDSKLRNSADSYSCSQARASLTASELYDRLPDRIKAMEALAKNMGPDEAAVRFSLPVAVVYADFYGDFSEISDKAVMLGRLDLATQDIEEGGRAAASALKYRLPYRYLLMVIRGKSREYTMQQFYSDFDKWKVDKASQNVTFVPPNTHELNNGTSVSSEINVSRRSASSNATTSQNRNKSTTSYCKLSHGFTPRNSLLSKSGESDQKKNKMISTVRKRKSDVPVKLTYTDELEIENSLMRLEDKNFLSVTQAAISKAKSILAERHEITNPSVPNGWLNYFLLRHPTILQDMKKCAKKAIESAPNNNTGKEVVMDQKANNADDNTCVTVRKSARIAKRKL